MTSPTAPGDPTPPTVRQQSPSGLPLPSDILLQARRRVQVLAAVGLLGSGTDLVLMVAGAVWSGSVSPTPAELVPVGADAVMLLLSIALLITARSARLTDERLLDATLVYEVVLCALIALVNPAAVYREAGTLPQLTWVTPLIILFPLIAPVTPRRMLFTSLAAAACRPLALLVHEGLGTFPVSGDDLVTASFGPAIAVAMAYVGARVVHGMGLQVARARRAGSYDLEEVLGRGGMGEVWRARHRILVRPAAVKLIRSDRLAALRDTEIVLRRFEREAQVTATLRSPHTVNLYDFGRTDEGHFYYVMELLDGLDLATLIERHGPIPADRVVFLLRQACHSLAEAHERGLVHRDVKPANLFTCRYGRDADFVKVLDFGLVQGSTTPDDVTLTAHGSAGGTPAFMAPEQALGKGTDARSDLYGLGGVAFWLLTGRTPFTAGTAAEMIVHHARTDPAAPSSVAEVDVPPELDRIVLDCLAKAPDDRPVSAPDLDARLAAVRTKTEWTPERARRWWDAHRPTVFSDGSLSASTSEAWTPPGGRIGPEPGSA